MTTSTPRDEATRSSSGRGDDVVVLDLDDPRAVDPQHTGAKAAALATAATHGLSTVPGFVLTTSCVEALAGGGAPLPEDVLRAWRELSAEGRRPLVVRSSSTVEDLGDSSMAGRFESVVDVRGYDGFLDAVQTVIASRTAAAEGSDELSGDEPLAVLVQPLVDAQCGGVLFGIDPVSGREDRLIVAAVEGGPDRLVSGEVDGTRYALDRDGVEVERSGDDAPTLRREQLRELAALARRTSEVFGGPQDVEWAYDGQRRLRLLQSRPVTAAPRGVPEGPVLGPGPVSETFPEPLRRLEVDMWVPPLRAALRAALRLAGAATDAQLDASPVVAVLGGRVAVDLDLMEPSEQKPSVWERLDPRPRVRRLQGSWRVGRLRAALPELGRDVLSRADEALGCVPELERLTDRQLVALLHRTAPALTSVHAHEVLVGLLVDPGASGLTGTSAALRVLARARAAGVDDEMLLADNPVVLALVPPRVGPPPTLPADVLAPTLPAPDDQDDGAAVREALRLRARWLQELMARAAWELGRRLQASGRLAEAADVAGLSLDDLTRAVQDHELELEPTHEEPAEPLPARFQVSDRGLPIVLVGAGAGTGAGGGRGVGPVHHGDNPPEGSVLVVRTLDPGLAPVLPRLAGLVAETGSVLAHLAILARESGVPTVVGRAGALAELEPGAVVQVDGDTGTVERQEEQA